MSQATAGVENKKQQELEQFEKGRTANLQDYKTTQDAALQDPNSPRSKALQNTAAPMFLAAGVKKEDIAKIPGADIEIALKSAKDYADAKDKIAAVAATRQLAQTNRDETRTIAKSKQDEDRIGNIRKEVTGSKAYQGWLDIKNASDNLQNAAANPTGKRSLGALYSYVKALDPGSVVREGEIALAGEARSVAERLEGTFRKWATGNLLTPDEIKELAAWAREKELLARQTALSSNQPAIEQAKRNRFDLSEINSDLFSADGAIKESDTPNEIRRKTKDGRVIVYDATTKQPLREEK